MEHWGAKSYTQINPLEINDLEGIEEKDLELMDTYNKISLVLETNYQPTNQRRKGRRSIRQRRN